MPDRLTISNPREGASLRLMFANAGPHTIVIDWITSVLIAADGLSTAIVPGDSRRKDLGGPDQPTVLVAAARAEQWMFADSECDGRGCGLFGSWAPYGFYADLAISVDGQASRLRLPVHVVDKKGETACEHYRPKVCVEVK